MHFRRGIWNHLDGSTNILLKQRDEQFLRGLEALILHRSEDGTACRRQAHHRTHLFFDCLQESQNSHLRTYIYIYIYIYIYLNVYMSICTYHRAPRDTSAPDPLIIGHSLLDQRTELPAEQARTTQMQRPKEIFAAKQLRNGETLVTVPLPGHPGQLGKPRVVHQGNGQATNSKSH